MGGCVPHLSGMLPFVPSGVPYRVEDPSPQHQSTYCRQIPLPQTLWGRQSMLHSFCDGPRECQCVPAAWLSQSSHTLGTPEGVGCHLPFSVKSSLEAQMSSVFWAVPEEISTVVCHRHHDRIWGSFGKVQRRASWLKPTPSACLPPACEGSFQVSHWQWLTETLPFQVGCRMWG